MYALVLVFASLAAFELWFGPYFAARSMGKETEMGIIPTPLPDSSVAQTPTSRVVRHGVSFEVPWTETEKSKNTPKMGPLTFTNGLGIYVYDPSLWKKNVELVRELRGIRATALRHELGQETLSSEFTFVSAVMRTTGNDAKWWRSPIYNIKVEFLLTEKMFEASNPFDERIPIYQLRIGHIRGFQLGSPQDAHKMLKLILFDETDHPWRIDILNTRATISQAEINAFIASLRSEPQN